MSDDAVDLGKERMRRSGDCRMWSVEEMLQDTMREAADGRWDKALVVLHRPDGNGGFRVDYRIAGCTTIEARGLMLTNIKEEILA